MRKRIMGCVVVLVAVLLVSATASAQDSAISGVVTDASGAILPGVTVEVTSPALIEGTRSVVTNGQGRYSVQNLRPGTYEVSFRLAGFSGVKREGIVLNAGFTAPVNGELKVGAVAETITVTGASPTVDVQNVRTQNVLTREKLDALPAAQSLSSIAALTLGVRMAGVVTQDVGGSQGEQGGVSIHNNRMEDQKIMMEGMNTNNSMGTNGGVFHAGQHYNMEAMQEVTLGSNGMGADTETAGAQVNYIPKDGGNRFTGTGRATFANTDFQANNLTSELKARGASTPPTIRKIWDYGGAVGGPIKKDKLWFFTAHRWWGAQTYQPGAYFNKTQGTPVFTPDKDRPAYLDNHNQDNSGRITMQLSTKDKIAFYGNYGHQCVCFLAVSQFLAPEAGLNNGLLNNNLDQLTWNRVQTSRLLFEAGFTYLHNPFSFTLSPGQKRTDIPYIEVTTGQVWGAFPSADLPYNDYDGPGGGASAAGQINGKFTLSYVTGSHNFKAGFSAGHGLVEANGAANELPGVGPIAEILFAGTPILITQYATPMYNRVDFRNTGIFAQDQWKLSNLTVNAGVRLDMFDGWSPAQSTPAGVFSPAISINKISDTPTWRDVSPRFGISWAPGGDSKTAIKVSAGRYVAAAGGGTVQPTNPLQAIVRSATRPWTDANGDYIPQPGELGPLSNSAFGTPVPNVTFDSNVLTKNRQYTWQASASVDRQLHDGVSVSAGYFYTAKFNKTITDNTLVTQTDFDQYCVTAPTDVALGSASGKQVCGLYDINPAKFGLVNNVVKNADASGFSPTETFHGVDISTSAKFLNGGLAQGGISVGKTVTNNCFVVDSPQSVATSFGSTPSGNYLCRVEQPWWAANGQIKLAVSYPIIYGMELAAVYQNLGGVPINANAVFTSAQVAASLGRPLAGGTPTVTIPLVQPYTLFEDRLNQIDFRVAKMFRSAGRLRVTLDIYNMLNAATIQARNDTYGTGWGTPTQILGGRLFKLGGQFSF